METNHYLTGKFMNKKPVKPRPYRLDKLTTTSPGVNSQNSTINQSGRNHQQLNGGNDLKNLENDLEILKRKLSDLTSNFTPSASTSASASAECFSEWNKNNDEYSLKLKLLSELFSKIINLDRVVLQITSEDIPRLARRNSKTSSSETNGNGVPLGSDLFHLPTHLILVDRLLDFHTLVRREYQSHHSRGGSAGGSGIVQNISPSTPSSPSLTPSPPTQISVIDQQEKDHLLAQLHEIKTTHTEKYQTLQRSYEQLSLEKLQEKTKWNEKENEFLQQIQNYMNENKINNLHIHNLEQDKRQFEQQELILRNEINSLHEQLQRQRKQQEEEQQTKMLADGQYSDEATREIFHLKKEIQQLNEQNKFSNNKIQMLEVMIEESVNVLKESQLIPVEERDLHSHENGQITNLTPLLHLVLNKYHSLHNTHLATQSSHQQTLQQYQSLQLSHNNDIHNLQQQLLIHTQRDTTHSQQIQSLLQQIEQIKLSHEENHHNQQEKLTQLTSTNIDLYKQIEWYQQVERTLASQVQEFHHAYMEADEQRKHLEFVISILREEEIRAQELIDDLKDRLTELSKNTGKGVNSQGSVI